MALELVLEVPVIDAVELLVGAELAAALIDSTAVLEAAIWDELMEVPAPALPAACRCVVELVDLVCPVSQITDFRVKLLTVVAVVFAVVDVGDDFPAACILDNSPGEYCVTLE